MNVKYQSELPTVKELKRLTKGKNLILLYDEKLHVRTDFNIWSENFEFSFSLPAGEKLKNLDTFSTHVKSILPALSGYSSKENIIVAVGGGSLGDFAGFLASVLKRGVGYVNVPSTWLAAVDSAHGGKTALNVEGLKNQIGTFYQPQWIFCIKSLLENQPQENLKSACGEVLKMGILSGKELFHKLNKIKKFDDQSMWSLLPNVVKAKYAIVKKDPFEHNGHRHLLNLGHTVGHALELENYVPHGIAVQMGLQFSTDWSYRRKILKSTDYNSIQKLLEKNRIQKIHPISTERFLLRLKQDKKANGGDKMRFVFIKKPGRPFVQDVELAEITDMARALGWVK